MRGHMATPKPGEIRCPTCHRSTPPAAFCTQCGSAIPSDARVRPRGMDRDELQDRIRQRRSGGDPYRRGTPADDRGGYERFEPDPNDANAARTSAAVGPREDHFDEAAAAGAGVAAAGALDQREASEPPAGTRPPDITRDRDDWARPAAATAATTLPPEDAAAPPPSDVPTGDGEPGPYAAQGPYDEAAYDDDAYAYGYEEWQEPERESSGAGMFAILGFVALGILALGAGAVLAGVFGNAGVGEAPSPSPSASPVVTVAPSPSDSVVPSASAAPSGSAQPSGGPVTFPDGFVAHAEPCIPGSASIDGCDSNGVSNAGSVWIWVGFENGHEEDVIGVTLTLPDGRTEDGSIDLGRINCRPTCAGGWTYFPFSGLGPGDYTVEVTRNGEHAVSTSFEVT